MELSANNCKDYLYKIRFVLWVLVLYELAGIVDGMGREIDIAVLDNDLWSARSLAHWIDSAFPDFHVVWACTSASQAVHRCLSGACKPDVLLVDVMLEETSGCEVCRRIRKQTSGIAIVGITAYSVDKYIDDMAKNGAQALLSKDDLVACLPQVIRTVSKGNSADVTIFRSSIDAHVELSRMGGTIPISLESLSAREKQVLSMYAHDFTTCEIADSLGVSKNSIFTYVYRIVRKLHVGNKREAIKLCKMYDLL